MAAAVVVTPVVALNGVALNARLLDALSDLRVVNSIGVPAYTRLSFQVAAEGSGVDDIPAKLGDDVKIECKSPVDGGSIESWKIFEGIVVSLGVEFDVARGALVIVEAYDKLYKLGRESTTRSYNQTKVSDIITDLAGAAGLTAQVDATTITSEATYRYGTSYAFLDGLIRQVGYEWYVDGNTLIAHKRTSSGEVTLKYGQHLRSFRARYSASDHAKDVEVRGWDPKEKKAIVGKATYSASSTKSTLGLAVPNEGTGGGKLALSIPRAVRSAGHANELAASIVDRRAAEALRARGEVDPRPGIKPGAVLALEGLGTKWSGKYYCTQVEHVFGGDDGSMRTFFEVGPSDPDSLVDIFGGAATPTLDKMLGSLTIGIVTNNNDPEGLGRVKLKLPYLSDDQETGWARVLQPGAGSSRGWTVIPEIDDEVLVGFEHGDIDHPYVLGGLANGKDQPRYASGTLVKDGKVNARVFSSRLGHEIRLSDGADSADQFVRISTPLGSNNEGTAIMFLGEDKVDVQAAGIPVKVYNDQGSIEIAKNGDITMESKGNITVKATKDVTIEGMNINVKSNAKFAVEASATLDLKSNAPATIESSAITSVKGSIVQIN